jgi:hypothetical protein
MVVTDYGSEGYRFESYRGHFWKAVVVAAFLTFSVRVLACSILKRSQFRSHFKCYIMFQLPNGCYRSEISVTPKNWKRLSRITRDWRIHYRFYDPSAPEPINQVRQITVKGMNVYKTICQRQESTQELLEITRQMLNEGYNPITKGTIAPTKISSIIHPSTSLIHALPQALSRITVSQKQRLIFRMWSRYASKQRSS